MADLLSDLAKSTGLSEYDVRRIMLSAPIRYKTYLIEKRSGGTRVISQPAREVKVVQRALIEVLIKNLPVHEAARAYRPGLSLLDNATPHAGSGPILKMDLKNFFPSIRGEDWMRYCRETGCLIDSNEIRLTTNLMFFRPRGSSVLRLAIGAPSSPALSNVLMYEFDTLVTGSIYDSSRGAATYTRYADDLTFSAPRTGHLNGIITDIAGIIRKLKFPKLDINIEKTTEVTRKYHRTVTGLTLSNDGGVTLGRDKKRLISSQVHRASIGKLSSKELKSLSGMLAYANSVEPELLRMLVRKYGTDILEQIRTGKIN